MTDSPEAIRADIERTRNELSRDADALVDKVTPSKIVDRQTDKIKGAFGSVRERLMGAADSAGSAVGGRVSSMTDGVSSMAGGVSDATHRVTSKAEGNPLAVGLMAFAAGLLVSSLIPASEKEKALADDVKEQAQPLLDEAKQVAQEVGQDLKEPMQEAATAVKDTATDAASHVQSEAQGAAGTVRERAEEARDNVSGS
jgi:gas vesicle protein